MTQKTPIFMEVQRTSLFGNEYRHSIKFNNFTRSVYMKKILMTMMAVFVLIVAGCGEKTNRSGKQGEREAGVKTEDVTLQLLKGDEEAGVTIENSEVYQNLDRIVTENPDIGLEHDFSLSIIDIVDSGTEDAALLFLVVNRLDEAIKNVSFDYTLGRDDGSFVWEGAEVIFTEEDMGVIQANSAVPLQLGITPEQEAIIDTLERDNQIVKIENFKFEPGE